MLFGELAYGMSNETLSRLPLTHVTDIGHLNTVAGP